MAYWCILCMYLTVITGPGRGCAMEGFSNQLYLGWYHIFMAWDPSVVSSVEFLCFFIHWSIQCKV